MSMIIRQYRLLIAKYRREVDLRQYTDGITRAVKEVLGDHIEVIVERDGYTYYVPVEPTRGQLIQIGRRISLHCADIRQYARIYRPKKKERKPIRQLFKRVKIDKEDKD